MRKLRPASYFGGSEILTVDYPQIINNLDMYNASLKNNSLQMSLDNFLHSKLLINGFEKFSKSSLISAADIIIPDIKKISAFFKENIAIYYPNTENDNFWFDLISLDYFYSLGFFKCCVVILPNSFIKKSLLSFDESLTILNS